MDLLLLLAIELKVAHTYCTGSAIVKVEPNLNPIACKRVCRHEFTLSRTSHTMYDLDSCPHCGLWFLLITHSLKGSLVLRTSEFMSYASYVRSLNQLGHPRYLPLMIIAAICRFLNIHFRLSVADYLSHSFGSVHFRTFPEVQFWPLLGSSTSI